MEVAQIRVVSGKGGVGKTVVATALAQAAAQSGARVLLCELNGRDRVAQLLGAQPVGYNLREVLDNLFVVDINFADALHEYVLLVLRIEALYRTVFTNRMVQSFINLVPSLSEMVMLGKIWWHAQQQQGNRRRFDLIVIDAPATGHALALLQAPQAVHATVPAGPMRDNAERMRAMLSNPAQTRLHVVTTAEEMPVTEAQQLLQAGSALGMGVGRLLINAYRPPLPASALQQLQADPSAGVQPFAEALQRVQRRRLAGEQTLRRLDATHLEQALRLPYVAHSPLGVAGVEALAAALQPAWRAHAL